MHGRRRVLFACAFAEKWAGAALNALELAILGAANDPSLGAVALEKGLATVATRSGPTSCGSGLDRRTSFAPGVRAGGENSGEQDGTDSIATRLGGEGRPCRGRRWEARLAGAQQGTDAAGLALEGAALAGALFVLGTRALARHLAALAAKGGSAFRSRVLDTDARESPTTRERVVSCWFSSAARVL
jgi:hypothetical protein